MFDICETLSVIFLYLSYLKYFNHLKYFRCVDYKKMDNRILNPRTNRYVTIGSTSHRRLLRENEKQEMKEQKNKSIIEDSESDLDDTMFMRETTKKKVETKRPSKKEKPLKKELIKKSVKLIKKNEDKFEKVKDSQHDTDRLLKKLLYKKLMRDDSDSDSDSDYF